MDNDIRSSIARNGGIMMTTQVITWTSSFVLLLFLPRILGSEAFGVLYLALSMAMILEIFMNFGGSLLIPKQVARAPEETGNILVSYTGLRLGIWVLGIASIMGFGWLVDYASETMLVIFIIGVSKLWEAVTLSIKSCFQGMERMEYPSIGVIGEKVFASIVAVTILLMGYGVLAVAIALSLGALLNMLISMLFLPKLITGRPAFIPAKTFGLVKSSLPYFLGSVFAVIYFRIDAVMLSVMTTDEVVGWYGAAYRFFDIVMFLPSILTMVAFPILARLWKQAPEKLVATSLDNIKILTIAAIPISLLIFFNASHIVELFFGLEEYSASVIVLQIFTVGILIIYIDFILGHTIMAIDRQRIWAVIAFGAIFVNLLLNFLLIPYTQASYGNGGIGAAAATLVTELYIMGAALFLVPRQLLGAFNPLLSVKLFTAAVLMAGVLKSGPEMAIHWIITAFSALLIYGLVLLITGVITMHQFRVLIDLFHYRNFKTLFSSQKT